MHPNRWGSRTRTAPKRALIVAVALSLGLIACSSDDDGDDASSQNTAATSSTSAASSSSTIEDTSSTSVGETAASTPAGSSDARRSKSCEYPTEAADGRYPVGDAGTVVFYREGQRLVLDDVEVADGWTHVVDDDDDDDEVEIDFFDADGVKSAELEADIEDGGHLEIEICVRG